MGVFSAREMTRAGAVLSGIVLVNWVLSSILVPMMFAEDLLPWHITIDAVCLTVAFFAFLVSWMTYDRKVPLVSYLGFGFLLVALFELSLVLSFPGQGIVGNDLLPWLFVLGRTVEALVLLGAVSGLRYTIPKAKLLLLTISLFGLSLLAVFSFPGALRVFINGSPHMTIAWGVFLYACYGATAVLAFRKLKQKNGRVFIGLGQTVLCTALAQTCLVFLSNGTDLWFMMGHHFKLCGYYFVFRLLVSEAVVAPFRQLAQQSAALEREVQERRAAQLELAAANEKLDGILSNSPAVVYDAMLDREGKAQIDFVSDNVRRMLGYTPQDFVQDPGLFTDRIHPKHLARVRRGLSHLLRRGYVQGDFRFRHQDGSYRWTHVKARTLGEHGAGGVQVVGCLTDLSERKRMERALHQIRRDKELILSTMSEKVMYFDLDMRTIWANAACGGQDGAAVLAGKHCYREWFGRREPCPECPVTVTLQTGVFHEGEITRPDGSVWFVRSHPVKDDDGNLTGAVKVAMDITERKKIEEELQRSQRKIVHIFESITDGFMALDGDRRITYINREAARITGREPKTLIGKDLCGVSPLLGRAVCGKLQTVVREQKTVSFEVRIDDGWWEIHVYPSSDGQAVYLRNVTARKQAEEQYIKLERLNVIGEMAAGIAHEVRNPMTSARGFLQLLEEKAECRPFRSYFELIISEIDRANGIITEFLALARNRPVNKKPINLNLVIETILPLIKADGVTRDKYVQTDLGNIPEVTVDDKEIRQLILNLARNGLEAMDAGGVLTISTRLDGDEVVLTVHDQGRGISPEVLDRLGTPFVTTKEGGTGLGLAVCHSIARRHNAEITVDTGSEGTTFSIRFRKQ